MFVSDILSQKGGAVFTVSPTASVAEISQQLSARRIGSVLVLDADGSVAGIVSERDLVRALARHGAKAMELEARQVMTREVVTCGEHTPVDEIMELMTKGRFRHLPVIEDNSLVGIVSIGDIVKHHIAEVELEVSAMRGYFATG